MISRLANLFTHWAQRWVPDAYVIAILLTALVFGLALGFGGATPRDAVDAWGKGFWELLPFAMQMCLIMLGGYVLAQTRPVAALMEALGRKATTPRRAVLLVALFSMLAALVNWGLSLAASAVFARVVGRACPKVDFRLLVACAYLGMSTTWHAGLSASAPLLVSSADRKDVATIPVIPVTQTIFSSFNLGLTVLVIVIVAILAPRLHPREEETVPMPAEALTPTPQSPPPSGERGGEAWSDWLERTPWASFFVGAMAVFYLWGHFGSKPIGQAVDLNTVNFILLFAAVLLHWTPARFLAACKEGGVFLWGIVIQFPFYAGIYGIIKSTALQDKLADVFVKGSTESTFPLVVYWYSGIVNYFVPSGGSKWFIEAPYIMQAGSELGVAPSLTVLSYAWGDMMTDAIQPFWAIPLLGLAGLKFRDIMGFLTVVFLVYATVTSLAFLLAPMFF